MLPESSVLAEAPAARDARVLLNKDRLHALARARDIDVFVATSPENVTYSSGYWALSQWIRRGPQTYVVLPAGDLAASCVVASTTLLDLLADQPVWIRNVRRFGYFQSDRAKAPFNDLDRRQIELYDLPDDKTALDALVAALAEYGEARIALDEVGLLPGYWEEIAIRLPRAQIVKGGELFRHIRSVKTAEEIERLRAVAGISERCVAAALSVAREGASELDLARAFHAQSIQEDCSPVLGCIGFGTRSAMPNVQPSQTRLRRGDVIRFDVGGRYRHYRADIARMAAFGRPDARVESYHHALHAGLQAGLAMIKPGVRAADVFETVVQTVRREGIPHYSRSHVGHGIGLDGYDRPDLAPGSNDVFEEGMVVCVETPYYEVGWCGLQVEDMIVVTADGIDSMMSTDGRLAVLA